AVEGMLNCKTSSADSVETVASTEAPSSEIASPMCSLLAEGSKVSVNSKSEPPLELASHFMARSSSGMQKVSQALTSGANTHGLTWPRAERVHSVSACTALTEKSAGCGAGFGRSVTG